MQSVAANLLPVDRSLLPTREFRYHSRMAKCGYVALIGRPNSGKSTLLNRLIGEKVSIVSDKPQTTRHRILGVSSSKESQIVFVDTPGIHRPGYRLNQQMMRTSYEAVRGVDVILQMVDAAVPFGKGEQFVTEIVGGAKKPVILILNKVDLLNKGRLLPVIQAYSERFDYASIVPLSALNGENVEELLDEISGLLPEREFEFPAEFYTDQQERGLVSELIREKVLAHTRQELPYSTAVDLEGFDEEEREKGLVRISASVVVDKPNQKAIVIGRGGRMIKKIGTDARKDIERLLQVDKVFLELNVKVVPGWRDQESFLSRIGLE